MSRPRATPVQKAQHLATLATVQPPPPSITVGILARSKWLRHEPCPLTDRLNRPSRSLDSESAPSCTTRACGLKNDRTLSITVLKSQKQVSSLMPDFRGTLTEQCLPSPAPTESRLPVPGKKSFQNWWKLTVITRLLRKKAYSTPSPWWTSRSTYSTRGNSLSSSTMQRTISFTQQNPEASHFLAWCRPPPQLIATSAELSISSLAQSMLAPAEYLQQLYRPMKGGQSVCWRMLNLNWLTRLSSQRSTIQEAQSPMPHELMPWRRPGSTNCLRYSAYSQLWN